MNWRAHPLAFPPGTRLCALEDLPEGRLREFSSGSGDSAFRLILYRHGSSVRAYVNSCPHFALPLNARPDDFILMKNAQVMCAWHSAVFRLEDGRCIDGPAEGSHLEPVALLVHEGEVLIAQENQAENSASD
jgi:nitrite reductase/ring-hydroxylating ferredoxin subunit